MNALVLINKPVDFRSTKCVGIAKKILYGQKVGHAGTLDSTASGLLIIMAGQATRLCEFVMSLPKVYRAVIQFGKETDTYDYSGEIISEKGFANLDEKFLRDVLFAFSGWRLQTPPAVSALKIDGEPAYKLARSGVDVEMKARPVFFREIKIISPLNSDGNITLEVSCSRGTYIRSLAHDLGKLTGCGAFIKSLERISIGNFSVENANPPEAEEYNITSLHELAENFTRIQVSERDAKTFTNGMSILLRQSEKISRGFSAGQNIICVEGDNFLGFGSYAGYDYVRPVVVVQK